MIFTSFAKYLEIGKLRKIGNLLLGSSFPETWAEPMGTGRRACLVVVARPAAEARLAAGCAAGPRHLAGPGAGRAVK